MSYYSSNSSPSWEELGIGIIILIVLLFARSCTSYNKWNNGICSCGGTYRFEQAIGHMYYTDYLYICDKCGRSIEVGYYYQEADSEATMQ